MMRIEGQINVIGTEAPVAAGDVERFIFEFAPRNLVADAAPEWTCAVPGVGRVRCVTFHDQSGAGLIIHLPAAQVSTAEEIGLSPAIQALCGVPDGLIVITGPRASGKSSMLNALVDVINRTRYDHVITIESRIRVRHERRCAFISQREVHGDGDAIASAARSALREGADVLVIEDLRAPEALSAALDAARAGRLVLGIDFCSERSGRARAAGRCVPRGSASAGARLSRRGAERRGRSGAGAQGRRRPNRRA